MAGRAAGKVALMTGGGSGIGEATVMRFQKATGQPDRQHNLSAPGAAGWAGIPGLVRPTGHAGARRASSRTRIAAANTAVRTSRDR